ncbi:MAG: HPr family phosphocarrier protein, partial [Verrucomicrobiota bacterium]
MESESPAISRELVLNNELGLHARPAALFVKTASRFRSEVWVEMEEEQVNGKSIMGLMMLAAPGGATL